MSEDKKVIAIDTMGGDKGPNAVLGGMNQFLYQHGEEVFFRIFGDEKVLRKLLAKYPRVARNCEVIHAPGVIKGTDKVMDVLRHAQDKESYATGKLLHRNHTLTHLVGHFLETDDRACHQLWEQRYVASKINNVCDALCIATIYINGITHGLKRVETDAQW